jgi:hypothetical protein
MKWLAGWLAYGLHIEDRLPVQQETLHAPSLAKAHWALGLAILLAPALLSLSMLA